MNRMLKALRLSVLVPLAFGSPVAAQEPARTIFGVDISGSSTFLVDQGSADAAGGFVEKYVAGLAAPHELRMVSVGDAGLARRIIDVRTSVTKTRASSAKTLTPQFGGYFRGLPAMAKRGQIEPQGTTSLVGFFRSLEPVCATAATRVIVFTDGLEWSSTIDGRGFAAGKVALPKPDRAFLKGCSVTMLGVGQVKSALSSDALAERLSPQWRTFLTEAGGEPVTVSGGFFGF